jgi:hypothetical protein
MEGEPLDFSPRHSQFTVQCSYCLLKFKKFIESCIRITFFQGMPTAIRMEAGTTLQAQAIFTMHPHPKAEEITIRAARATGLTAERAVERAAERAAERASRFPSFCDFLASPAFLVKLMSTAVQIAHKQ